MKILVIDDNNDNLITLKALIQDSFQDAVILMARCGSDGLAVAAEEKPDVILLDIVMPGMDGYEVCRELKSQELLADIPVVFLTAIQGSKESRIKALEAGGDAFLTKPVDASELTAQIGVMLKIRTASIEKKQKRKQLETLVETRTQELQRSFTATLNLLEDLHCENERRQASENALRDSEERYRTLFKNSALAIGLRDLDGSYIEFNEAYSKMLGYSVDELKNLKTADITHPDDIEISTNHMRLIAEGRSDMCRYEKRYIHKNGSIVWGHVCIQPLRDRHNRITTIIGSVNDITERKQAEAVSERLMTAIEQAGDVVFVTDSDGKIQYVNPAFETVTGYSRQEAIGKNPRILKSGKQNNAFYKQMWNTIIGGQVWRNRIVNKRKDGSLYTVDATISPVRDNAGRIVSFVAVRRDVTDQLRIAEEQAQLEGQLQQAQKVEAIGRLAGGVAHDFNNMLSIILGYGESILSSLRDEDPLKEDMKQIVEAGRRSAGLTRQLLAFSRKQTLQPELLDLNEVIRNLEKMLRRLINEDIKLTLHLTDYMLPVWADPGQIEQVIMNLAVNARDAMQGGGTLCIETSETDPYEVYNRLDPEIEPGNMVLMTVSDTGCGMTKEETTRIFEPFFTTKVKGKGTGLGLSTVYGIVRQSGGNITVNSEPGKGTVFEVSLPRAQKVEPGKKVEIEAAPQSGGMEHILVVEDEYSLRRLVQTGLSRRGYRISVAANGGEALLLMEEKGLKPDLLLTDVVMPNMSGRQLVDRLRRNRPDLKVLYMSGYTDEAIEHHGVLDSDTPFIQKPFNIRELVRKIQEVFVNAK